MKKLLKIAVACLVLYGLLHWAISNPNSASSVKLTIDELASTCADKFDELVDFLTDEEQ
jgi:hypothetical protein